MLFNNRIADPVKRTEVKLTTSVPHSGDRAPLKYEQLVAWAVEQWRNSYGEAPYRVIWADETPANEGVLQRLKIGRRINGKTRYGGHRPLNCPHSIAISYWWNGSHTPYPSMSVGAYAFQFTQGDRTFEAIYASAHNFESDNNYHGIVAIALVPVDALKIWLDFEKLCRQQFYRLMPSTRIHVIGGSNKTFEPNVSWNDVILPEALKESVHAEVVGFFKSGAALYRQLGLPPFRKLLFVGAPGTGKSTLCAALAKVALKMRCVVIYISAADEDGASFDKVQHALYTATHAQQPVLMVLEELDAYMKAEDKSQILNVLDGFETPNNRRGTLLLATTNHPEVIDQRIAKRPGRVDRVIHIPEIQDVALAERLLRRYMGNQWHNSHAEVISSFVGQTAAFVREVSLHARMLALNEGTESVSLEQLKQSIQTLMRQVNSDVSFGQRRSLGFGERRP